MTRVRLLVMLAATWTLHSVFDAVITYARHDAAWREFQADVASFNRDLASLKRNLCILRNEVTRACVCNSEAGHGQ